MRATAERYYEEQLAQVRKLMATKRLTQAEKQLNKIIHKLLIGFENG